MRWAVRFRYHRGIGRRPAPASMRVPMSCAAGPTASSSDTTIASKYRAKAGQSGGSCVERDAEQNPKQLAVRVVARPRLRPRAAQARDRGP